jgi:hypothetical protein
MSILRVRVLSTMREAVSRFIHFAKNCFNNNVRRDQAVMLRGNTLVHMRFGSVLLVVVLCQSIGVAQTTFSSIVGTVVDDTGADVPGATVIITNEGTALSFTTSTAPDGNYSVEKLLPGTYMFAVSKPGFEKVVNRNLVLQAQKSLRLDITLKVGSVTTQVDVVGKAPVVETESGELSFTRSSLELDVLPVITPPGGLNSSTFATNDPLNYVFSLPGAGIARPGSAGKLTIDGSVEGNTMVRVDGINLRDNSNGVGYGGRPTIQGTEEFKVIGVDAPAEFDMPATVLISTKQGTNQVHGGLFYDGQQRVLNARNFFLPASSRNPFSRRNDVGAYIGGPIIKNKLFYFGSWEIERSDVGTTLKTTLPLPAFKTGDFSALIDPTFASQFLNGTPIFIHDPLNNGAPFPGNIIPANRLNSVSTAIQNDFYNITPNLPGLSGNNVAGVTAPVDAQKVDARIDYSPTRRHQIFGHFSYGSYNDTSFSGFDGPLLPDARNSRYPTREVSVSDTYSISAKIVNEFKGGFFRYVYGLEGQTWSQNKDWQTGWGLQEFDQSKNLPHIGVSGFATISSLPPIVFTSQSWELLDNLTFLKGNHTFKVGVDVNRPRFALRYDLFNSGLWSFSNKFTGYAYSDFLLGYPSSTDLTFVGPVADMRSFEYSAFFQDTFQATHDLTLTYGVRWTNSRPATVKQDVLSNYDPATGSVVLASEESKQFVSPEFPTNIPIVTAGQVGFPGHSLRNGNPYDFAPRFGFAYRVRGSTNTVVRGGYGLFFAPYDLDVYSQMGTFGVFRTDLVSTNLVTPGTTVPEFQFPNIHPSATQAGSGQVGYYGVDKNIPDAHYNQVHLAVEHGFGNNVLSVSYIGNYGKQDIGYDVNQAPVCACVFSENNRPFPAFSTVSFFGSGNVYNYSALEVVGERRFNNGLFFRASYDFAKALTNSENDNGDTGNSPENSHNFRADYGNVSWTPRHTVRVSYSYDLPFGKAKRFLSNAQGVANGIVGGWQISGITTFRSGLFFSPSYAGYDSSGTGTFSARPDVIGNGNLPSGQRNINDWFNASAFVCPGQSGQICDPAVTAPIGRFGNTGRNTLVGPRLSQWDVSLFKAFPIRETIKLRVRMEAVNVFNSPAFGFPAANVSDPSSVGRITSTVNLPRVLQFGATLDF